MKVRITKQNIIPWKDINIEQTATVCDEINKEIYCIEAQPLDIRNFCMGKNNRGQLVFTFDSKNHKYFDICENMGSMSWDDNEVEGGKSEFGSKCIELYSYVRVVKKSQDGCKIPRELWSCEMIITPENKEEKELIGYKVVSQPLKWSYALTFMVYSDFDLDKQLEGSFSEDEKMEEDMIYFFETDEIS